jgi:glycosyltransferase involved in cell wall biosynthesis
MSVLSGARRTETQPEASFSELRPVPAPGPEAADRIRVLKFLAILAIGGSERQAVLLGQELDRTRFDVHLGCCARTADNIEAGLTAQGVPITQYSIRNLYGVETLRQRVRLAQYLRRERIDVVHSYNFYSNAFAIPAARLARVPVIIASIRDNGECWTPWQRRLERLVCRLAHRVVVNADVIKRRLAAEGYDARRITVIPNGTRCPASVPASRSADLREELDLPAEAPVVGMLARLDPIKGIEYFLEAAAQVSARRPDVRFLIVGDNRVDVSYREDLTRLARRLRLEEVVRFTGFRNDVAEVLSLLSVSVLASLSEGLSNTLLESMAAGIPVVATAVGGNPEAVEHGVTGILVPPKNAPALADAICRILNHKDQAAAMGLSGRRRVTERFSTRAMVSASERLYGQLLAEARRSR